MEKNIGIVGLGLIGGSLAKAIKANLEHRVFGWDINQLALNQARLEKAIDGVLDETTIPQCDTIILCVYPNETVSFVKKYADFFKRGIIIVDCAGVKTNICNELSPFCAERGIYFVGGHPMAGIEKSGYEHSYGHLFDGATMILCKDEYTNSVALKAVEMLFLSIGFLNVTITTAAEHDKVIAFTSQLAHIVSNAYIRSDSATMQKGFSAGSYKDLTRVAYLNEVMWTELFFENRDNLIFEAEGLIERISEYVSALKTDDREKMKRLLYEGKKAKETVG